MLNKYRKVGCKLRKSLKVTLILLGMTAALVGIIATVGGLKSGIDNLLTEGKPVESIGKKEFDEMVEIIDGKYRLTTAYDGRYDETTLDEIFISIHGMSHNVIVADKKWGKKAMSEENINTEIIRVLAAKIQPKDQETLLEFLTAWKAGNFSEADVTHNYIWSRQGGTVGLATGVNSEFKADWLN